MLSPNPSVRLERREDGVAVVTLDRPPVNALDTAMMDDLTAVARELTDDPPRAVLLRSSTPGVFMAGADLEMVRENLHAVTALNARLRVALDAWERLPVPTVAVIGGHALGGGCELALVCDFRIMARGRGRIGLPEVQRGLVPAGGGTQRLPRLIGRAHALDLLLRGRMVSADRAAAIGLVTEACEAETLDLVADEIVAELAGLAPLTLGAIKRVVLDGLDRPLSEGLDLEADAMADVGRTADAAEGVASFLERRSPVFRGA